MGVRQMRLRLRFARLRTVGNELLEVQSDFCEKRFEAASGSLSGQEPATKLPLVLVDREGAVDFVRGFRVQMSICGDIGGQGVEVVVDRLGAEILPRRVPRQAGGMLQLEPMLDPLLSGTAKISPNSR
jgi:hypothetical protein